MLRATYVAGFPIDWQNAGNGTTHQLPADLTDTLREHRRRGFSNAASSHGKASENMQGATTRGENDFDAHDKDVIENYKRVGTMF